MTNPSDLPTPGRGEGEAAPASHTLAQAARGLAEMLRPCAHGTPKADTVAHLQTLMIQNAHGVGDLNMHIPMLDALFHHLITRAADNTQPTPGCADIAFLRLALRAQRQCRRSVMALQSQKMKNKLKGPKKTS
jgi:hypothetical protein